MTITNWIFAKVCYFILFIGNFPAYVVDNWMCEDRCMKNIFEKNPLNSTVLLLKVIYSMETLKVAITQVAMEIQL